MGRFPSPLIGRVQAAGLTTEQLRQELADKWGENYLQDPQVTDTGLALNWLTKTVT